MTTHNERNLDPLEPLRRRLLLLRKFREREKEKIVVTQRCEFLVPLPKRRICNTSQYADLDQLWLDSDVLRQEMMIDDDHNSQAS